MKISKIVTKLDSLIADYDGVELRELVDIIIKSFNEKHWFVPTDFIDNEHAILKMHHNTKLKFYNINLAAIIHNSPFDFHIQYVLEDLDEDYGYERSVNKRIVVKTLEDLIDKQDSTFLYWDEPRTGLDNKNNEVTCNITNRATVSDCIKMDKWHYKDSDNAKKLKTDMDHLVQFMTIHWAYTKEE